MARQHTSAKLEGQYFNEQDRDLSHELRYILRTTRIDYAAFRALPVEVREARWRAWGAAGAVGLAAKRQLVVLMFESAGAADWTEAEINATVATFDARCGAEPTATEAATAAALVSQIELAELVARNTPEAGRGQAEAEVRAAQRALELYIAGARPELQPGGVWVVESGAFDGTRYQVELVDRRWRCSCPAGKRHCKHAALVRAVAEGAPEHYDDPVPQRFPSLLPPAPVDAPPARLTPEIAAMFRQALARHQRGEELLDGIPLAAYEADAPARRRAA